MGGFGLDSIGGIGGLSAGLQGISALTSLFGGKSNDYGSVADMSAGRGYLGSLAGIGGQYGSQAASALGNYSADQGQYRGALGQYGQYLQQDPFTDARSTADLARAGVGSASAYQRARANLMASGAASGTGGAGSSSLMGGLAGIDSAQAGQIAGAQNTQAYNQIQQHHANMQALMGLYSGAANEDYSRGMGALGAQQGVDQSLASQYLGMGEQERQMQMQQQAQQNQAFGGALGGLASLYGTSAGYKAAGGYSGGGGGVGGGGYSGNAGIGFPTSSGYPSF